MSVSEYPSILFLLRKWGLPVLFPIAATIPLLKDAESFSDLISLHSSNTSLLFIDALSVIILCLLVLRTVNRRLRLQSAKNRMFRKIINRIPISIVVYDAKHRYLYLNPAAEPDRSIRERLLEKDDFEYLSIHGKDLNLALERRKRFMNAIETHTKV